MGEILFRGKAKESGEWVEGDLVRLNDGGKVSWYIYGKAEVDPATVGQFTGLVDANGKKIFEGDILCFFCVGNDSKYYGTVIGEKWNCNCCHGVFGFATRGSVDLRDIAECEIAGNIHDNPELAEVAR